MNIVQPNYPAWAGSPAYRELTVVTDEIVHHGDDDLDASPLSIDAQHRSQGWCGIGYHFVIGKDGTIYRGRPLDMVPAAAQDDNTKSVDICLTGDFQPGTDRYDGEPTAAQVQSLKELSVYVHQQIPSIERIVGHRDVAKMENDPSVATACPGDTLYALLPEIRTYTAEQIHR